MLLMDLRVCVLQLRVPTHIPPSGSFPAVLRFLPRFLTLPGPLSALSEYSFQFPAQLSSIYFTLVVSAAIITSSISAPPRFSTSNLKCAASVEQ